MSGGSYDYAYRSFEDLAERVEARAVGQPNEALRLALADHLRKLAKALHDLEWVDSCDYGAGREDATIREIISPQDEIGAAVRRAEVVAENLAKTIERAKGLMAQTPPAPKS